MMLRNSLLLTALLSLSINCHASLIDNNFYTTDTTSGLDWLDLTETVGYSYNYISTQLGSGGEFEGWQYALFKLKITTNCTDTNSRIETNSLVYLATKPSKKNMHTKIPL